MYLKHGFNGMFVSRVYEKICVEMSITIDKWTDFSHGSHLGIQTIV